MLKMLTSDEDLAKFDLQELMKKILHLKTQLAEKEKQLTNKQMKEMMLLQVIKGTVSTQNMFHERINYCIPQTKKMKWLAKLDKQN